MTIQEQVRALEGLVEIDAELKLIEEQIAAEQGALSGKKERLAELDERLERGRGALEEIERTRGESTQDFRQLGIQMDRSREKLSRCRNEREANAVQRELEELRKLIRDREVEIQKLAELATQARTDMEKAEVERKELLAELGSSEGDVVAGLAELEASQKAKLGARKLLMAGVPAQLFRRYELVRKRRGSAVCHTTNGTCSVCFMTLNPMLFQQLRRGESFSECPSCNRILYFKPPSEVSEDDKSE